MQPTVRSHNATYFVATRISGINYTDYWPKVRKLKTLSDPTDTISILTIYVLVYRQIRQAPFISMPIQWPSFVLPNASSWHDTTRLCSLFFFHTFILLIADSFVEHQKNSDETWPCISIFACSFSHDSIVIYSHLLSTSFHGGHSVIQQHLHCRCCSRWLTTW